jgi:N-sulfoglucosamine sulfohydrolase
MIRFLQRAVLFIASAALAVSSIAQGGEPTRPNILWLTAEDISPNLGCYGDNYAITPNLDRFAAEGVRYNQAFGITGVCAPNRSCLITGVYPSKLGSHGMRSTVTLPDAIKCFTEYLRSAGYYCCNNAKTDYNFAVPKTAWDESSRNAHYQNRKSGQPFFAVFNHEVTHEGQIRVPAAQFKRNTARLTPSQRHAPERAPVPPYHPDTPETRRDWAKYYDNITAMDYQFGDKLKELEDAGLAEDTIVFFFGDNGAGMPGCKKWVWDSGLRVPLIIRFPKKWQHLAPGLPGTTSDRLVSFVDLAPTVLSLAGMELPRHFQGTAFLGKRAGSARQYVYAIRDRMAERYDCVRVVRNQRYQYNRNFMPHLTWSQFVSYTEAMPTMKAWRALAAEGKLSGPSARYFAATKPAEELYDTQTDPHQVSNLAADPRHRATLEQFRAECERWMLQSGDLGLVPEFEMHQAANSRPLYDLRSDSLPELLRAAALANSMQETNLPQLIKLLDHTEASLRWWGALGLVALRVDARPAEVAIQKALADAAPEVRVAAAEVMSNLGNDAAALPVLTAALRHESAFVRLAALKLLDRFGPRARPVLSEIRAAGFRGGGHVEGYVNRMVAYLPAWIENGIREADEP